ncbi:Uncharacterised protein [Salmonella enterica subsp. enterica serovar Typhimurium]|nr:Uncharacterised protein [Salmonella enterica subsp. enterica serovar Typhimurium]
MCERLFNLMKPGFIKFECVFSNVVMWVKRHDLRRRDVCIQEKHDENCTDDGK